MNIGLAISTRQLGFSDCPIFVEKYQPVVFPTTKQILSSTNPSYDSVNFMWLVNRHVDISSTFSRCRAQRGCGRAAGPVLLGET